MEQSKTKFATLFAVILAIIISVNSTQAQNQGNWQYMGRVFASYSNGHDYKTWPSVMAQLYSSFDGEKVTYKLIIGGEVYTASKNSAFSQSTYDEYVKRSQDDHFRGPHLKNSERYPYRAGKYYFNPAIIID